MSQKVTESQFYMWRALFAMSHADNIVTDEEIRFMTEALEDLPFSPEQKNILKEDIFNPQDIVEMYGKISDPTDQAAFFNFARELVWIDGDYGEEEQEIMLTLKRMHVKSVNLDELVGRVGLQLEPDDDRNFSGSAATPSASSAAGGKNVKNIVHSFRERFLKGNI
ncbi:MAG: hypothetical protein CMH27_02105 [Micavibrio sp.]|nr:hypothetical protein [Micavibrio sp.]|tara:strand:- start:1186 stop:1683 length:498 start_codon:yes stop_codon:yes gene_type:complete